MKEQHSTHRPQYLDFRVYSMHTVHLVFGTLQNTTEHYNSYGKLSPGTAKSH